MKSLKYFLSYSLVKLIKFIQSFNYRVLKNPHKKGSIELLKHFLNFYSLNLKNRKPLNIKSKYSIGINIDRNYYLIDINKFTAYEGSYAFIGQAPLLKTANEIYKNESLSIEETSLYKYYRYFQPKNYGQLYNLEISNSLYYLSSLIDFKPWIDSYPKDKISRKGLFGPEELNEIKHRIIRIKNIFKNIERYGYLPTENDIVKGYLLVSHNDYRFLITSGHHRIAVLKTLNSIDKSRFNYIPVKFENQRSTIKIVNLKNIEEWPSISNKACFRKDAIELFNKYFYP